MSFWLVVCRDRLRRPGDPVLRRLERRCCSRRRSWSRRCCSRRRRSAGFVWTRRWRYGPFFLGAGADRRARDDGRLPRRDAAPPRPVRSPTTTSRRSSSCARPTRRRRCWRSRWPAWPARGGLWRAARRARRGAGSRAPACAVAGSRCWCSRRGRCHRPRAGRPGLLQADPDRLARRRLGSRPRAARQLARDRAPRATCSRSTPGAARSTRSCRR